MPLAVPRWTLRRSTVLVTMHNAVLSGEVNA